MANLTVTPISTPDQSKAEGPKYDEDFNELSDAVESDVATSEEEESNVVVPEDENKEEKEEKDEDEDGEAVDEEEEPPEIPFDRPSLKEIKAQYPDFFKKFPSLKEAFFREAQFTQVFPTIDDAKEALSENEAFTTLSDAVLDGDPSPLLESIEKTDKKAFETFSLSFLPTLYKRNQELYHTVVTPLFEGLLRQIHKSGDDNMKNSALNIASWLFGNDGEDSVTGKKTLSKPFAPDENQKKIKEERELSNSTRFRETANEVSNKCYKTLKFIVQKDFDPESVFTPFLKNQLVEEVIKRVDDHLKNDKGHQLIMGTRWKRAKSNGYSEDERSKLISTYLARAKSLVPSIRENIRSAALGKTKKVAEDRKTRIERSVSPRESTGGLASNGRGSQKKDYKEMSDIDILND